MYAAPQQQQQHHQMHGYNNYNYCYPNGSSPPHLHPRSGSQAQHHQQQQYYGQYNNQIAASGGIVDCAGMGLSPDAVSAAPSCVTSAGAAGMWGASGNNYPTAAGYANWQAAPYCDDDDTVATDLQTSGVGGPGDGSDCSGDDGSSPHAADFYGNCNRSMINGASLVSGDLNPAIIYQQQQQQRHHHSQQQRLSGKTNSDPDSAIKTASVAAGGGENRNPTNSVGSAATRRSASALGLGGAINVNNNSCQNPLSQPPWDWMKKQTYPLIPNSGKTRTKDKYRIVYTELQKVELEKEFLYNQYITIQRKAELANSIGLSDRQVKIWFQNRRAKDRKQKRKRDETVPSTLSRGGGGGTGSTTASHHNGIGHHESKTSLKDNCPMTAVSGDVIQRCDPVKVETNYSLDVTRPGMYC